MSWTQVCYLYDGSFAGFLTCVFDSYQHREEPAEFATFDGAPCSLYPQRPVETRPGHARRVYRALGEKLGGEGRLLIAHGFLTCLPQRELWLWRVIRMGLEQGGRSLSNLADPTIHTLRRAVNHLTHEAHQFTGFVRFSQIEGVLVGEIEPKNRVLPLLRPHFCSRYPGERFVLYDRTYREVLLHQGGKWAILPLEHFEMGPAGEEELQFRRLWRTFYHTISIQGRYNPKCRRTNMPMRYWNTMTEFQTEDTPGLPPSPAGQEITGPSSKGRGDCSTPTPT